MRVMEEKNIDREMEKLEEERRITKGPGNKRRIKEAIWDLEAKGSKIYNEIEEITAKTIHITNIFKLLYLLTFTLLII